MYRWTRHVYDGTRKYYLLGRDRMLDMIADQPSGAILEVGCGTARNLRYLARHAPQHEVYGMDASNEMLDTARRSLRRKGYVDRVTLAHGLASGVTPEMLGRNEPFDIVFCSYVLSMIPQSGPAIEAALRALRPGGRLYVVDFWDQKDLPAAFAWMLQRWLSFFDVRHRPGVMRALKQADRTGRGRLRLKPVAGRYAYLAQFTKAAASNNDDSSSQQAVSGQEAVSDTVGRSST